MWLVGVDIEEIGRFNRFELDREHRFLERVFTLDELGYAFSQAHPAEHLAARFAAKEAVIKALAQLRAAPIDHKSIEICRTPTGMPKVVFNTSLLDTIDVQISMSHSKFQAIAFSVVQVRD